MRFLPLVFTFLETIVCLLGLTFINLKGFRNTWFAAATAPLIFCTALFCTETFVGLRDVRWLGIVLTIGSLIVLFRFFFPFASRNEVEIDADRVEVKRQLLSVFGVFGGFYSYALLWRFAFPDIDRSSEKIADLAYICTYLPGSKIPCSDAWLYPYLSTQYYSFQHYCASLYGRLLGLDPGTTYNLSFCLLIALIGTAFTGGVFSLTKKRWARWMIPLLFLFGGSGASLLIHFTETRVTPWAGMRFIGSATLDQAPLGPLLNQSISHWKALDLPGEPFSYSVYLGDYHAPLFGYYLLGIGVMCVALLSAVGKRTLLILGGCLTWCILGNTWILPLVVVCIGAWWALNSKNHMSHALFIAAGALTTWIAATAYLRLFCGAASSYDVAIRWIPSSEHPPVLLFAIFLGPTLVLSLVAGFSRDSALRGAGLVALLLLILSECLYVDDIYSGRFNRFNTTLKWWPWISAATLLVVGSLLAEKAKSRTLLIAGFAFSLSTLTFVVDLGRVWWTTPKPSLGQLDGTGFISKDLFSRLMLERLRALPIGVVIERPKAESFTNSACLPLFAGHKMWLGWIGHEQLWRGYRDDLAQRQDQLQKLFDGDIDEAGIWAAGQGINYILWYQNADDDALWHRLNSKLSGFVWEEIYKRPDGKRVGLWRAPNKPSGIL